MCALCCVQLGDSVKKSMQDTLQNYYGVDFQHDFNRFVTDAWDKTQERVGTWHVSLTDMYYTYFIYINTVA